MDLMSSAPASLTRARVTDNANTIPRVDKRDQRDPDFRSQLIPFVFGQHAGVFHVAVVAIGNHHSL